MVTNNIKVENRILGKELVARVEYLNFGYSVQRDFEEIRFSAVTKLSHSHLETYAAISQRPKMEVIFYGHKKK